MTLCKIFYLDEDSGIQFGSCGVIELESLIYLRITAWQAP